MLSVYPACFIKEEDGYTVLFPDLGDVATDGDTLNEAMEMAIDCLAGYLFSAKIDNDKIPAPSALDSVDLDRIYVEYDTSAKDCFLTLVSVDVEEYAELHFNKPIKKTLTIPEWLNQIAIKRGINFSKVLKEALINELNLKD